jgi:hypothetical protein
VAGAAGIGAVAMYQADGGVVGYPIGVDGDLWIPSLSCALKLAADGTALTWMPSTTFNTVWFTSTDCSGPAYSNGWVLNACARGGNTGDMQNNFIPYRFAQPMQLVSVTIQSDTYLDNSTGTWQCGSFTPMTTKMFPLEALARPPLPTMPLTVR